MNPAYPPAVFWSVWLDRGGRIDVVTPLEMPDAAEQERWARGYAADPVDLHGDVRAATVYCRGSADGRWAPT